MTNSRLKTVSQRLRMLALTSTALVALPAIALATGLPGAGVVAAGSVGLTGGSTGSVGGSTIFYGLNGPVTLNTPGSSVVVWGANGAVDGVTKAAALGALSAENAAPNANLPGFNIASGQKITVTGGGALLNVDASGNPSTIAGTLTSTDTNIFVANANGIVVTSSGSVSAPLVGLIGADVTSDETKFGTTGVDIGYASGGGSVSVAGSLSGVAIVAGAGTVNVSGPANSSLYIFGGIGGVLTPTTFDPDFGDIGTETPVAAAHTYAATDVSLTNQSPAVVFTDGDLALAGNTALTTYGWTGTLSNAGVLSTPGNGYIGGLEGDFENPWAVGTAGSLYYAPIGSVNNSGTIINGQTIYANGFTNTGTIYTGLSGSAGNPPNAFSVYSESGDVSVGGKIAATSAVATVADFYAEADVGSVTVSAPITSTGYEEASTDIGNVTVSGAGSSAEFEADAYQGNVDVSGPQATTYADLYAEDGNVLVSAPFTITGNSSGGTYADDNLGFYASASGLGGSGNVTVDAPVSVTDSNPDGSLGALEYVVGGNSVDIEAAQTVSNPTYTGVTGQPDADIYVNKTGGTVDIASGASVTAGDVYIGYVDNYGEDTDFDVDYSPDYRAAVTVDGDITATNSTNPYDDSDWSTDGSGFTEDGAISIYGTSISGKGTGDLTAQQFNFDYTKYINSSVGSASFLQNGILLTSEGDAPTLNLLEAGNNLQNTNVTVDGNITVNVDSTSTSYTPGAFVTNGVNTGTVVPGNAGSHVVISSTGDITLGASSAADGSNGYSPTSDDTGVGFWLGASGDGTFWSPGLLYLANVNATGTALNSANSITATGAVANDYLIPVAGYQGIYFGTDNLDLANSSVYTNENSWVNFATAAQKAKYAPFVYAVAPFAALNTLNVVPSPTSTNVYNFLYGG